MFYSCGMNLSVNDKIVSIPDAQASEPLVWVLRDTLGLVGTRYGCGIGVCGTCNLLLDGVVARACQPLLRRQLVKASSHSRAWRKARTYTPCSKPFSRIHCNAVGA
jgi:hypothetical protein